MLHTKHIKKNSKLKPLADSLNLQVGEEDIAVEVVEVVEVVEDEAVAVHREEVLVV